MEIGRKKRIREECWNVDYELIKWLNEHSKIYLEEASKMVDLEYHKFNHRGKELTQAEAISRLIYLTDYLLKDYYLGEEPMKRNRAKNEIYDLLKLLHWQFWW